MSQPQHESLMSDSKSEKSPETPPKKPDQAKPANGKSGLFMDVIFNLVVFGSICALGYLLYEQDKAINVLFSQQNDINSVRRDAQTLTSGLEDIIRQLQAELAATQESLASLNSDHELQLETLRKELISTRLGLSNRYASANQESLLTEAVSVLRLAQQHLIVSRDLKTAQALYLSADNLLKQVDDPLMFSVREILAGELAAIRAVSEVDTAAIYLQLGAIGDQINQLSVTNDLKEQIAEGDRVNILDESAAQSDGLWDRMKTSLKTSLDTFLVVRRRDAPLQAMMTPGQEAALMQSIRLQLEQARTALLKGEQEIYSNSLGRAHQAVEQFLSGDLAVRSSVLDALGSLQGRRIVSEIPPLNRTRVALEEILAVRASQPAEAEEPR